MIKTFGEEFGLKFDYSSLKPNINDEFIENCLKNPIIVSNIDQTEVNRGRIIDSLRILQILWFTRQSSTI